ncbi:3,4-dioxygenase subunit beta [Allorhizocola rhizosphaerae]|uniref:dioxygenase family protein n=1 Tax=Allorhizocola rhizosphaerae TaxID=1872709 RepID=UPI000E3CCC5B|nr:3,4-dioxygenase subunit beta [Allorhizocola rhizosphaerae]
MDRSYEGRPLAKPHEEIFDQGLGFDLGILRRRQLLRAIGIGMAGWGLAACGGGSGGGNATATSSTAPTGSPAGSASTGTTGEIPEETAGPYPGDGSNGPDVLEQSGVVRGDIRSSFGGAGGKADGIPMTLELVIKNLANDGAAFAGAAVYVWHCDREGRYSLYSQGVTGENYLRGVQIADADGKVRFTSIFPACYPGRWPHIHFEVFPDRAGITDATKAIATSQVALPAEVCKTAYAQPGYESSVTALARVDLSTDNVFGEDDGVKQLGTVTGDVDSGYTVSLVVGVE